MNKHFFYLILFLIVKVQAHTFMPLSDFINEYEAYAKEKTLSIRLARIQTGDEESDFETIDYNDSQDPVLLKLRENSLQKKTMPWIRSRNFRFDIVTSDFGKVGRILLHEGAAETHGSFFYITNLHIARKHEGKGIDTKALQELVMLFETINPYCEKFSTYVHSYNPEEALLYARAGFWVRHKRIGTGNKDVNLFADFIFDNNHPHCSKIMIRERNDSFISIPTELNHDKQAIIKILSEIPQTTSTKSKKEVKPQEAIKGCGNNKNITYLTDKDFWQIAKKEAFRVLYSNANVPSNFSSQRLDSIDPRSINLEPALARTTTSTTASSPLPVSVIDSPKRRSISSFLWQLFSTVTLNTFDQTDQTNTTQPLISV